MRRLRGELGLTQEDIAARTSISQARVSQIERGEGDEPTDAEVTGLMRAFIVRAAGRGFEQLVSMASRR
jgi:transcriptional regulator with XRE-family HTH domain